MALDLDTRRQLLDTVRRFVEDGRYPLDWGASDTFNVPDGVGRE